MSSGIFFVGLAAMQVLTGSLNTIFVKVADEVESKNSEGNLARFEHPLIQVSQVNDNATEYIPILPG